MNDDIIYYEDALVYLSRGGEYNDLLEMHTPLGKWEPIVSGDLVQMRTHAAYRLKSKPMHTGIYTHEEIMTKWFRKKTNTVWSKFTAFDESRVAPPMYEFNHTYWISYNDICREFFMSDMPR